MSKINVLDYVGGTNPIEAINAKATTSDKYKFQSTESLINRLERHGLEVVGKSLSKVRKLDNEGYQKHVVVFTRDDFKIDDNNFFQLLVTNNHNASGSLKFDLGIYRTVCANGLVVGDNLYHHRIPHIGREFYNNVDVAIEELFERMPLVAETVRQFKSTETSKEQRCQYIKVILGKLFEGKDNIVRIDSRGFNPKRQADLDMDVYTVYNRIQEVVLKGGLRYQTKVQDKDDNFTLRNNKTRKITSINRSIEMNKYCWDRAHDILLAG
jgi:hypothetical protein